MEKTCTVYKYIRDSPGLESLIQIQGDAADNTARSFIFADEIIPVSVELYKIADPNHKELEEWRKPYADRIEIAEKR